MKTHDEMIKLFDTHYEMLSAMEGNTKDFTPLIKILEFFLRQMKITGEVSENVKKELGECSDEEFTKLASKRLAIALKELEKERENFDDSTFNTLLFKLPDKKGKTFFELMKRMEEAGKLSIKDKSKRIKIDSVIEDLENYVKEIKEISQPFIPASVDEKQTIIFKVMFKYRKGIWRKIEMKASQTLEGLHSAIQDTIGWDNDHLYSFFMNNKFYSGESDVEFTCPYEPEGRQTADVPTGAFAFKKGQKFAYLFDFGDCHRFEIEVIDFGTVQEGKKYPVLLESKGKSPEQYSDWDEE